MFLGDYGAEVIKVEHPRRPDPARGHGPSKDGVGLWFKALGAQQAARHARPLAPGGPRRVPAPRPSARRGDRELPAGHARALGARLGRALRRVNPRLVLARVTGFGQIGPYAARPGFGTLAEAMSGFAAMTGEPGRPADAAAVRSRRRHRGARDRVRDHGRAARARARRAAGQVIDTSLIEPMLTLLGPQLTAYDQLGELQPRTGNRSSNNAPRNTYRTADGKWVAVSASATSIAERVMRLVGRAELIERAVVRDRRGPRGARRRARRARSRAGSPSGRATR